MQHQFQFSNEQINRLFPFHFILNEKLEICQIGSSLAKMNAFKPNDQFQNVFFIPRPLVIVNSLNDIKSLINQLVILEIQTVNDLKLRGQFEILHDQNEIIFIGSPWFNTIEDVVNHQLVIDDFAKHDSLMDFLHIAKSQQINYDDLKNLVVTINEQKNALKKANKQVEEIALFPTQNPDPLIRINFKGEVLSNNPAASLLDFIEYKNQLLRHDQFFEIVAKNIDINQKRWTIEAKSNGIDFSFVCIPMLDYQYINIYGRDITQQKKDQKELEVLSFIVQKTNNAVIITNTEGNIEWVNNAFQKLTEYSFEEVNGKKPGDFLQGENTDKESIAFMRQSILKKEPFTCEIINYSKSKKEYWLRIKAEPILDAQGNLLKYFAIQEDISIEKEAQQKLDQQRKFYEQILDNIPSDIAVFDKEHTYLYLNPTAVKDQELRQFLIGKKDEDYIKVKSKPIEILHKRRSTFNEVVATQKIKSWEETILLQDGTSKTIVRNMYPLINKDEVEIVIGYGIDITEIKKFQQQVILSEKRFKDVIENSLAIITTHDLEGNFLTVNPMVSKIYGYSNEEMLNKKITNFIPEKDRAQFYNGYLKNIIKDKKATGIFRVLKKNGEIIYTLYNNFLKEDVENTPYVIGFAVDVTDRINAEKELKLAKKQMEELAISKQNFLANMSHEIRTPMNAIIGMANQLNKTNLLPKQTRYLNSIQNAAENLLVIMNDILDFSKMEAGKLSIEEIGFEPSTVIANAIQIMVHKAEEKGLELTNSYWDQRIADVLIGDPYRINQILLNLLSNAIKFTENGVINISCEVIEDSEKHQQLMFSVTDTGIGIEAKYLDKIFQKFNQEDDSITRKYGGTGLGMSICKDLVQLMKGSISIESKKNKGTKVQFTLPLKKGTILDLPQKLYKSLDTKLLEGKSILIVDDNEMNRLVASTILENHHLIIHEATNGAEAIDKIKQQSYDIILMDIQMPIMDGIKATNLIRNELKLSVPIIALTALTIKEDKVKILQSGMNDYISKPFNEINFIGTIIQHIKLTNENTDKKVNDSNEKILYDLSKLDAISNGNNQFIAKMIKIFIEQSEKSLLELANCFEEKNKIQISKIAHRLKPSIDNLGIEILYKEIRELENNAIHLEDLLLEQKLNYFKQKLNQVIDQLKKI